MYCCSNSFCFSYQSFKIQHYFLIIITCFFIFKSIINWLINIFQLLVITDIEFPHERLNEIVELRNIMIKNSYWTWCLVSNIDILALLNKFLHCSTHTDNIVIRMGTEYQHFLMLVVLIYAYIKRSIIDDFDKTVCHISV